MRGLSFEMINMDGLKNCASSNNFNKNYLSRSLENMNIDSSTFSQEPPMFQSLDLTQIPTKARKVCSTTRDYSSISSDVLTRSSIRESSKFYDVLDLKKQNRMAQEQETREKQENLRGFLRHTTYAIKKDHFFIDEQIGKQTSKQPYSATLPDYFAKKRLSENNCRVSNYQKYESNLKNFEKTSLLDIDRIANKVKKTASYIQQLKQLRNNKRKILQKNVPNEQQSKISQINSTFIQSPVKKKRIYEIPKFQEDLGFKKRIYDNFYTPKPETQDTSQISENIQKIKRGHTPTLKTTLSPCHKKSPEKPKIEDFIIEKKLGGGKFGTVFRAYHIKTCSVFALKKIQKKILQENMLVDQFIQEVKIQSLMRHSNIMDLYGVFDDKDNIYMILELMPNGNLYGSLKKKGKFTQSEAALVIKQISRGIVHMHDLGIAHRDLKPENIVISNQTHKICDFGWAAFFQGRRRTCCGTFDYTAPQILEGGQYDMAVDYWGLGVIAYELMVGKPPFYHQSKKISIDNALNVEYKKITFPPDLSSAAKSFIQSLLRKDPSKRLSYTQILQHSFLINVKTEEF